MKKVLFLSVFASCLAFSEAADTAATAATPNVLPATTVSTSERTEQSLPPHRSESPADVLESELEFTESPTMTVDVLMVAVSMEKLQPLLGELRNPETLASGQKKLLELVSRKEAKLINWPQATAQQGIRGISESVTEKRYAVAFEFPELNSVKTEDTKPAHAALPTVFETRNIGATMIFQGAFSPDNKSATIQLSVRVVDFLRYDSFVVWTNAKGTEVKAPQPIVMNVAANATFTLKDGERQMMHAAKLADAEDMACVFIAGLQISAQR